MPATGQHGPTSPAESTLTHRSEPGASMDGLHVRGAGGSWSPARAKTSREFLPVAYTGIRPSGCTFKQAPCYK